MPPSKLAIFPSLPRATRGNPIVLGCTPDGEKILYCNGKFVYTVPIHDFKKAEIYAEHHSDTTVAKISPCGCFCATGDSKGTVRVWDTVRGVRALVCNAFPLSGAVRDIAWCRDSKRLAVVGEGKGHFGNVFLIDTNTSNGSIDGVSARLNTVDFKPTGPFRIVAGGDNKELVLYAGPPFKLKNTTALREIHENYIYSARYSPDGTLFASCGGDKKVVLYDAHTEEMIGVFAEFNGCAHNGSVYALAWSPDGEKLATASADQTVTIWDVDTRRALQHVTFPSNRPENQQLAVIWTKKALISVSASGAINELNPRNGRIISVRQGHNKAITHLAKTVNGQELYSSDAEGNIVTWDVASGTSTRVRAHFSKITGMGCNLLGELVTVGFDDRLRLIAPEREPIFFEMFAQPTGLATTEDGPYAVAICQKIIAVLIHGFKLIGLRIDFEGTCVALSSDSKYIAVGDQMEHVIVYTFDGKKLGERLQLDVAGNAVSISFSPDGHYMVATTTTGKAFLFDAADKFNPMSPTLWTTHNASVLCSAWSPDSTRFATGSLDRQIILWDVTKPREEPFTIKQAHPAAVNALVWMDETTLVSGGQDSNINFFKIPL